MYRASYKCHHLMVGSLLGGGALVTALTLAMPIGAQTAGAPTPKIEQKTIPYVTPVSGKQMYDAYCAVCHGANGKGNVKASSALSKPVTDLTLLTSQNSGKFPSYRIRDLLLDQDLYHDRAPDCMPVWAPAFKSLQKNRPDLVGLRVQNLVTYLETLQVTPTVARTATISTEKPR